MVAQIERLPVEVKQQILSELDRKSLFRCLTLNRTWSPLVIERLFFFVQLTPKTSRAFYEHLSTAPDSTARALSVYHLDVTHANLGDDDYTAESARHLVQTLPKLKPVKLSMEVSSSSTDPHLVISSIDVERIVDLSIYLAEATPELYAAVLRLVTGASRQLRRLAIQIYAWFSYKSQPIEASLALLPPLPALRSFDGEEVIEDTLQTTFEAVISRSPLLTSLGVPAGKAWTGGLLASPIHHRLQHIHFSEDGYEGVLEPSPIPDIDFPRLITFSTKCLHHFDVPLIPRNVYGIGFNYSSDDVATTMLNYVAEGTRFPMLRELQIVVSLQTSKHIAKHCDLLAEDCAKRSIRIRRVRCVEPWV